MNDIFSKLDSLKSIEPSESWVVDNKKRVLSEAPVFERKSILERLIVAVDFRLRENDISLLFKNLTFKKAVVPAFSLVFVLSTGIFTLGASESSYPGEFLYPVKMAKENIILAIASEDEKAEVEMKQVGKRIEEFDKISKNYSDPKQGEKIGMLLGEIEIKTNRAEEHLTKIEDNGVKTRVAKVVGAQGEKYTEVLAKTVEGLPVVVKDEISEETAKAVASSERIYLTSLAVIVEEDEIVVDNTGEEDQEDQEDGEEKVKGAEGVKDTKEPVDGLDDSDNNSDNSDNNLDLDDVANDSDSDDGVIVIEGDNSSDLIIDIDEDKDEEVILDELDETEEEVKTEVDNKVSE